MQYPCVGPPGVDAVNGRAVKSSLEPVELSSPSTINHHHNGSSSNNNNNKNNNTTNTNSNNNKNNYTTNTNSNNNKNNYTTNTNSNNNTNNKQLKTNDKRNITTTKYNVLASKTVTLQARTSLPDFVQLEIWSGACLRWKNSHQIEYGPFPKAEKQK